MAEPQLISAYVRELRYSLRTLRDVDDVVAEADDHLRETAAMLVLDGRSRAEAEQEAVARFGSASLVSKVFISEARMGAALATALTKRAGMAAFLSPLAIAGGGFTLDRIDRGAIHDAGIALVVVGTAAFLFGCWGLRARAGGLGRLGLFATWLTIASPLVAVPFGSHAPGALLIAICLGVASLSMAAYRSGVFPRMPVLLLGCGAAAFAASLGLLAFAGLDATVYGPFISVVPAIGIMWCGALMWHEPHSDQTTGGLAAA